MCYDREDPLHDLTSTGEEVPSEPERITNVSDLLDELIHLDLAGDGLRVLHLGDGGDEDVVLPGFFQVVLQALAVDGEIDHTKFPKDHLCYLTKTPDGKILKSSTVYIRDRKGKSTSPPCRRTW